ncbi:MAG: hypothetical protein E6R08_05315 [Nevskiaceae bacterium]|nr:MAG: hypothetical protein E6R08_05315 [Nevskiaceae bacterium]
MDSQIFRIVAFVEAKLTPFAISRLIMLSGVSVRKYGQFSKDDVGDLRKVRAALKTLLNARDLSELEEILARAP